MKKAWIKLGGAAVALMMALVFAGCEGPRGPAGAPGAPGWGAPGQLPRVNISTGTWWIGTTNTGVAAAAEGEQTPRIINSYWWIDETNTEVRAHESGAPGRGATFVTGVFEGISHGRQGPVRVWVTFSANNILDITIAEEREMFIHSKPLETIPPQILQFQTLNVDIVSGATLTSNLVVAAVEDAAYQATGRNQNLLSQLRVVSAVPPRSTQVVNVHASLVVVGAGSGGVQAAMAAAEIARDRGLADVVLLEAHSRMGGSGTVRGPGITVTNVNIDGWHRPMETTLTPAQRDLLQSRLTEEPGNLASENRGRFIHWQEILVEDHARHMSSPWANRVFDSLAFRIIQGGNPTEQDVIGFSAEAQFADAFNRFGVGLWCSVSGVSAVGEWPRGYRPGDRGMSPTLQFAELFHEAVRRTNLPLRFKPSTPAISLMEQDDVVIGVVAQHVNGRTYRIFSPNTLLISGSFASNAEMMMIYCVLRDHWTPQNHRATTIDTNRGDGINMARALRLPAQTGGMTTGTGLGTYHAGNINQNFAGGMWNAGANWNMAVNALGVRFGNEALGPGTTLGGDPNSVITNAFAQPGQFFWQVVDVFNGFQSPVWEVRGNIYNSYGTRMLQPVSGQTMPGYYIDPANPGAGRGTRTRWTSHLANRDIQGWPWVVMADTLEELAVKMRLTPEQQTAFLAQAETWNAMIDGNATCPWQRTAFMTGANQMPEQRNPVLCPRLINSTGTRPAGPFVASPMRPSSHTTGGGLQVNNGRVLRDPDYFPGSAEERVIPGLFASGNVATMFAGSPTNALYLSGEILVRQVIFGN